mgnify:CR=1 FL=1
MNYRVCKVHTTDGDKIALFHRFVNMTTKIGKEEKEMIKAIIEFEDGSITVTSYKNIKFTNSKAMLNLTEMGEEIYKAYKEENAVNYERLKGGYQ